MSCAQFERATSTISLKTEGLLHVFLIQWVQEEPKRTGFIMRRSWLVEHYRGLNLMFLCLAQADCLMTLSYTRLIYLQEYVFSRNGKNTANHKETNKKSALSLIWDGSIGYSNYYVSFRRFGRWCSVPANLDATWNTCQIEYLRCLKAKKSNHTLYV